MGLMDRIRKTFSDKKEPEGRLEVNMSNLRVGDLVEYDLKTWEAAKVNSYEFDGDITKEFVLKNLKDSDDDDLYIEKSEDGWMVGISIPIAKLDPNLKIILDEKGEPPSKFHYKGTTYHLDEEGTGYLEGKRFDYWDFIDEEDEKSIGISSWPNAGFECTVSEWQPERKFKVQPGSI